MGVSSPTNGIAHSDPAIGAQPYLRSVGILSTSHTGLQEIACLLAQEVVGVSQALRVDANDLSSDSGGSGMLGALQSLQCDANTEIAVLLSGTPSPRAAERVLSQVRDSDKPTVVCFLGVDPRMVWRAGAIPAARLDEAALRAAAWVRGWDQALISSSLEAQDEALTARARTLRQGIGPGRRRVLGLFASQIFCREAQLMLAEVASDLPQNTAVVLDEETRLRRLRDACDEPQMAVILMDAILDQALDPHPLANLGRVLPARPEGPAVVAHVCGLVDEPKQHSNVERALGNAGITLTPSNAAAARLAGMLLAELNH